jgi:phosphoglycolate phosphatase
MQMHTTSQNPTARIAIEPDFAWDGQDAYLFDIDGTLLRSRDRVHFDSFAASVQRVTGFEITLGGILLHGKHRYRDSARGLPAGGIPAQVLEERVDAILEAMRNSVAERRHELDLELMPGVEDVLRHLAQKGALLGVATGNLEAIGWIKIEKAGCASGSGLAASAITSPSAAGAYRPRGVEGARDGRPRRQKLICVVGDTPRDIEAAHSNFLP